jgi:hypothetical protein
MDEFVNLDIVSTHQYHPPGYQAQDTSG